MQNTFNEIFLSDILYKVTKPESVEDIAAKFDIDKNLIYSNNNVDLMLEKGDVIFLPLQNVIVHIVKPLDSLTSIASKYNVTPEQILSKNNIETLFIGQKIYI